MNRSVTMLEMDRYAWDLEDLPHVPYGLEEGPVQGCRLLYKSCGHPIFAPDELVSIPLQKQGPGVDPAYILGGLMAVEGNMQ